LHLAVSLRSFRAESLSAFVGHIIENRPIEARRLYSSISERYPILLTRRLDVARDWLREHCRGSERVGFVASSGARRLRPDGIWVGSKVNAPTWFLNDGGDVRSSNHLEEVATEFDIQGLELDWTCVCWDADFRFNGTSWAHYKFRGTSWQRVNSRDLQLYLKNAYRVLLTRARQGMMIFVPGGDPNDDTRLPGLYDETFRFLEECGIRS